MEGSSDGNCVLLFLCEYAALLVSDGSLTLWFSDSLVLSSPYTLEPIDLLDGFRLMRRLRLSDVSGDELISLSDSVDEPWLSVGDSE